ncbi:hypothetical protein AAU61_10340 [Desulfocarbo indianensis]|nr:hypothetical protein AAU61_10340 [Desulfocarbo indianensis]
MITDKLALTAAHCVCRGDWKTKGCDAKASFILHEVFPVDDPKTPADESKTRKNVTVKGTVRVHPEYSLRGWLREDLAVVELEKPISQVAKVKPIPVEEPQNTPLAGEQLTVVGYGSTGKDCKGSGAKMMAKMEVQGSEWGGIGFKAIACGGDSGGPALNAAGKVVGVASWTDNTASVYRPTGFSYNWIFDLPRPSWSACVWVKVAQKGIASHQAGKAWCPQGSFLVALDLDRGPKLSAHDDPVIGSARCCKLAGAENNKWASCAWHKVGQAKKNSHQMLPAWCPNGSFLTQIDLDADAKSSAHDSPKVGQVRCCKLSGAQYQRWGSSYWIGVEKRGINSHGAGEPWCLDGAFLTQFDQDADHKLNAKDSPVVGQAKCSRLRP